jgi:hypothetical protein
MRGNVGREFGYCCGIVAMIVSCKAILYVIWAYYKYDTSIGIEIQSPWMQRILESDVWLNQGSNEFNLIVEPSITGLSLQ